ncbi:hypothetical protein PFZ49_05065 [Microbacterium lacticum]|uniref:hypothetical protein n=1 Tax=Microbacterium lacticum TaxID=33885 RepID=UPI003A856741
MHPFPERAHGPRAVADAVHADRFDPAPARRKSVTEAPKPDPTTTASTVSGATVSVMSTPLR